MMLVIFEQTILLECLLVRLNELFCISLSEYLFDRSKLLPVAREIRTETLHLIVHFLLLFPYLFIIFVPLIRKFFNLFLVFGLKSLNFLFQFFPSNLRLFVESFVIDIVRVFHIVRVFMKSESVPIKFRN